MKLTGVHWLMWQRPLIALLMLRVLNASAAAQEFVEVMPGEQYRAGPLRSFFIGQGYRSLWTSPVRVPVLNLAAYAGGLTAVEQGGRQTRTLHLRGADGRAYLFRSVDKFMEPVLPPEFADTPLEALFQDATAFFLPSGALAVPPLLSAIGLLHVKPELYVMPDDPRLGEFRQTFAGMLGQLEERPEEGAGETPGFAGSRKVAGTDKVMEELHASGRSRIVEEEWLAARLTDFIIGDTDRGTDQWRWARFEDASRGYKWRPIPRDRDWTFLHADGLLAGIAHRIFPKVVTFNRQLPSVNALTFSSIDLDRTFLRSLDRLQWRTVVTRVRESVTDDVIGSASEALPAEHFAIHGDDLVRKLRARRTGIMQAAMRFYDRLAEYVDVHGTDARDRAEIQRAPDGTVQVRLYSDDPPTSADDGTNGGVALDDAQPYYSRTFLPGETKEVRLYLHGGADRAVISGVAERSSIRVRVVGGPGDDVLVDSALAGADGDWAWLYDAEGSNRFVGNEHTVVDRRTFQPPDESGDWVAQKIARERFRDWGSSQGFRPAIEYRSNTGFSAGVEWNARQYGFRRVPFESDWEAQVLYAPGAGAFGATAQITRHLENSPIGITAAARASGFDDIRFYGFGNESSELPSDRSRVERLLLLTRAGLQYAMAGGYAAAGGIVQYTRTPTNEHPVLAETHPFGVGDFMQGGLWAEAERATADDALRLSLVGAFYPPLASVTSSYGKLRAIGVARLGSAPILALRAGAEQVWGHAPFHDAAFLGGRGSLRGYSSFRFVGNAAVFGNAELRIPIGIVKLLARGELGVFALGDAGRVFVDGSSPGDWHTAYGGGLWFSTLGRALTFTFAQGEQHKVYIGLDFPY